MEKVKFIIQSIWEGITPSQYFTREGNYLASIGIDPDLPISDAVGDRQTSGQLRPSGYAAFDGSPVDGNVIAIINVPEDSNTYVVLENGTLISYNSSFGGESEIGTVTGSKAHGATYYNNYIYIFGTGASEDDVSRYGPLDNSPTLANGVWKGSTLGSQTALTDTTYPSLRGSGEYPNHWGYVHTDNRLYFPDYVNGQGFINYIKTTKGTDEGDTDDGSQYQALELPFGFKPTCLSLAPDGDIAILGIMTNNSTINQGKAAIMFWDGAAPSFYRPIQLPDSLATAMLNNNGVLYIWSGAVSTGADVSNGYRISQYVGGRNVSQLYYSESGACPMPGAVEAVGNRIYWGTFEQLRTTTAASPTYYGVVMAMGSKRTDVPQGVHGVINSQATGAAADGLVTAIRNSQQASLSHPRLIVASRDASGYHIVKQSTTYGTSVWRSQMFNLGSKFKVTKIRIPLGTSVGANMTITPKIFYNDFSSSSTLTVINNTNYPSKRVAEFYPDTNGENNFCLELTWTGTALLPVLFPIEIEVMPYGD